MTPEPNELFFFGLSLDKFAPHKAARILGLRRVAINQDGDTANCFLIEYGDGEKAFAEIAEESVGAFEVLTYEEAVGKHGEDSFT